MSVRLLVTGASGFIGRAVVASLLAAGHEVHSVGRTPVAGTIYHEGDLLRDDPLALVSTIGATHLVHLAWYAVPGRFWTAVENLDWLAASLRLVCAFAHSGGERVVTAGTGAEYDWHYPLLDEATTPVAPATLYGRAKAALGELVGTAADEIGVTATHARIFWPYGPEESDERLLGSFLRAIARSTPAEFSAGTQRRDFIHVEDAGAAIAALALSSVAGPVNIASGTPASVRALIETAESAAGISGLARFGARPPQAGEPAELVANITRLRDEVGFAPRHDLMTGVADAVARGVSHRG